MFPLDAFDKLHVVSDLHMGGQGPGQMFDQGARLAQWLDHVRSTTPEQNVAVCLNGDTVDFLAEPAPAYFDGSNAVAKLERIVADPAFAPAWKALNRLVRTKRRTLILTLGNHDLELALPWVREHLLRRLSGDNEAARGRIRLAFDGAGYLCRVGAARVLCLHGNDVDAWNRTDYETLRRQGRNGLLGQTLRPWTPNAGTKLVIDVMNEIKRQYPFVDLLKPEVEAVVPILYALRPDLQSRLRACMAVAAHLAWDSLRHELGFLAAKQHVNAIAETVEGGAAANAKSAADAAFEQLLQATFSAPNDSAAEPLGDPLLVETERRFRQKVEPMSLLTDDDAGSRLGWTQAAWNWLTRKSPSEILRAALSGLARDQSFDVKHADETFRRWDDLVAHQIEFVVVGHTHLERALRRGIGNGIYYNSGTWARLIRLSPDILASADQFARYDRAFRAGTMAALDGEPGLILRRRTLVSIVAQGARTQGGLYRLDDGPNLDGTLVEGSEWEVES